MVRLIPGAPIARSRYRAALALLGLDPDDVSGLEGNSRGVEVAWNRAGGTVSTYSRHEVLDDAVVTEDRARFLVVDLDDLPAVQADHLRKYVAWLLGGDASGDNAPF